MDSERAGSPKPDETFRHPDPVTDAALDWFVRLQDSPDDEALKLELQHWLDQDPRHAAAFVEYQSFWEMPELEAASRRLAARQDEAIEQSSAHRARRPINRWVTTLAAAAAVLLVAIGIQQYPVLLRHWEADYLTATGERNDITLPDGSRMTLNTASAVAVDFAGGRRSIRLLEGEAFFDVVHDADHPFRVAGAFGEVEVRGTAFSVRTASAEDTVVLERGSVQVSRLSDLGERAMLAPGEMVTVSPTAISPIEKTDPEDALAWLDGRIIFHERPFAQVLNDLRRYYGGPVVTLDSRISQLLVSGNYRLENPEGVLRSLAEAAGVSVTRLPGGILILR
ncbi:MAG: FecR family protein [Pseudomonadota bacterium]